MNPLSWQPFVALNAGLMLVLGAILWYKFHRLRLSIEEEFRHMRDAPPPILIGEAFLAERFEAMEREMLNVRVRLEEIERLILNGEPPPARPGGSV